jgi:hypothetical protein
MIKKASHLSLMTAALLVLVGVMTETASANPGGPTMPQLYAMPTQVYPAIPRPRNPLWGVIMTLPDSQWTPRYPVPPLPPLPTIPPLPYGNPYQYTPPQPNYTPPQPNPIIPFIFFQGQ